MAPTDHRPVTPTIGFRIAYDSAAVVLAGDTLPGAGLADLAAGADALVHTVIRQDLIAALPQQRIREVCDDLHRVDVSGRGCEHIDCPIEGDQADTPPPGQGQQVNIGHLAVASDRGDVVVGQRHVVDQEAVDRCCPQRRIKLH